MKRRRFGNSDKSKLGESNEIAHKRREPVYPFLQGAANGGPILFRNNSVGNIVSDVERMQNNVLPNRYPGTGPFTDLSMGHGVVTLHKEFPGMSLNGDIRFPGDQVYHKTTSKEKDRWYEVMWEKGLYWIIPIVSNYTGKVISTSIIDLYHPYVQKKWWERGDPRWNDNRMTCIKLSENSKSMGTQYPVDIETGRCDGMIEHISGLFTRYQDNEFFMAAYQRRLINETK
jgi:hypothetical protein